MRHTLLQVSLLAAAALMLCATFASAQTTAVGPYYATPSWDQTVACTTTATCPRFVVLSNFNTDAVLDRETGLVWERVPDPARRANLVNAFGLCLNVASGGRGGWRLPTAPEISSLLESSTGGFASGHLPPGHPFTVGGFSTFWTSTIPLMGTGTAGEIITFFTNGDGIVNPEGKDFQDRYWCVRSANSI